MVKSIILPKATAPCNTLFTQTRQTIPPTPNPPQLAIVRLAQAALRPARQTLIDWVGRLRANPIKNFKRYCRHRATCD